MRLLVGGVMALCVNDHSSGSTDLWLFSLCIQFSTIQLTFPPSATILVCNSARRCHLFRLKQNNIGYLYSGRSNFCWEICQATWLETYGLVRHHHNQSLKLFVQDADRVNWVICDINVMQAVLDGWTLDAWAEQQKKLPSFQICQNGLTCFISSLEMACVRSESRLCPASLRVYRRLDHAVSVFPG